MELNHEIVFGMWSREGGGLRSHRGVSAESRGVIKLNQKIFLKSSLWIESCLNPDMCSNEACGFTKPYRQLLVQSEFIKKNSNSILWLRVTPRRLRGDSAARRPPGHIPKTILWFDSTAPHASVKQIWGIRKFSVCVSAIFNRLKFQWKHVFWQNRLPSNAWGEVFHQCSGDRKFDAHAGCARSGSACACLKAKSFAACEAHKTSCWLQAVMLESPQLIWNSWKPELASRFGDFISG